MSGMAHFFMSVGGSKFHERLAHFFIDIYTELRLLDPQSFRWLMEGLQVEQKSAIRKGKPKDLF